MTTRRQHDCGLQFCAAADDVAIVHLNERHVKLRNRKVRGDNLPNNKTIAEKSVTQYIKPTQL